MSDAYIGEIRMFGGTFAPQNWLMCDGSMQSINTYDVLFQLLGTTYGGDGQNTFGLPDMRGRVPVHQSGTVPMGLTSGSETITLNTQQLPGHTHPYQGSSSTASASNPSNNVVATATNGINVFLGGSPGTNMSTAAVGPYGGGQSHPNIQPFQCINFIICTEGLYPQRSS